MKITSSLLVVIFCIVSCSKNEITMDYEHITDSFAKSQPSFYKYYLDEQAFIMKITRDNTTRDHFMVIFADQELDSEELIFFTKLRGFSSQGALMKYYSEMNEFYLSQKGITFQLIEAELKNEIKKKEVHSYVATPCETARTNCIIAIASEATIMHLGCAILDPTGIPGIICHGAAIAYQISGGNACNATAASCNSQSGGGGPH